MFSPTAHSLLLFFSSFYFAVTVTTTITTSQQQERRQQVERFQQYLRIRTAHPDPDYASAVAFLWAEARSIVGIRSRTLEFVPGKPVFLVTWEGADPSLPSLLLNTHIDSVPAENPSRWIHPPFSASYDDDDGRIFARGAQDDKCLAVQYLEALRSLSLSSSFTPLRSIHVSFVPDEEIGGRDGMAKFAASEEFRALNVGFVLDEGQASPTDDFRVFYADRTPWSLIVRASAAASASATTGPPPPPGHHGSRMTTMMFNHISSAVDNLMDTVEAVAQFRENQFDLVKAGLKAASEVISVIPVYMKAGGGITSPCTGFVMDMMQPSEAEAGFDVRLPPTADPELIRKRISEEWAPITRNMTFQVIEKGPIRDYSGRPLATATNESNPWWLVFKQAVEASGGKLSKPEILASTTDARFMRQMGIPTLGFSPMANTPILLHEHNEFLKDTVFLKGIKVYEHVIRSLSSFRVGSV